MHTNAKKKMIVNVSSGFKRFKNGDCDICHKYLTGSRVTLNEKLLKWTIELDSIVSQMNILSEYGKHVKKQ